MRVFQYLPILIATATSRGFTIPDGQPEGVYQVSYDANGNAIHTFLHGPINHTESTSLDSKAIRAASYGGSPLLARQSEEVHCASYALPQQDTKDAIEGLKRQCDTGVIRGNLNFYSWIGGTVVYLCNLNATPTTCNRNDIDYSVNRIAGICTSYTSGWNIRRRRGRDVSIGYERTGSNFCARGSG
ncbi:hypothetical protein BDV96DRAFT_602997 [Lophiotrema nucula]|uniref:Uncharacterized protein n=1 Tax=Lophiotrema nucula TaxID=690887 RepID=A0A6A5YWA4_9PLEO|nr:hypothetical protein BDV96DRAFT_602997 [Lophiotrema nucula]